jgi:hypothetical protein
MPKAVCRVCEADVRVSQADAVLEVVEENPLGLEEVFEDWDDSTR